MASALCAVADVAGNGRDFRRAKGAAQRGVALDVGEGHDLAVEVHLPGGRERFADRVGLDDGHVEKIEQVMIARLLPAGMMLARRGIGAEEQRAPGLRSRGFTPTGREPKTTGEGSCRMGDQVVPVSGE